VTLPVLWNHNDYCGSEAGSGFGSGSGSGSSSGTLSSPHHILSQFSINKKIFAFLMLEAALFPRKLASHFLFF
jgi:hypothetical protein